MADDWEQEDWEAEDFKPQLPASSAAAAAAAGGPEYETAGQALLAKVTEPDMSKFADEDQEEPEEETSYHIKPQPKKKVEKKYAGRAEVVDDTPLDDPEAEKARRQRLEEEADFRATNELFGGERAAAIRALDSALPKTVKDYEELAERLAKLFVLPHAGSKGYRALLKSLLRAAAEPISADDAKELENTAGTIRADKVKAEKAAAAAKKGAKKNVNVGKGGGTAGLDDYIYDAPEEDEYDFM